MKSPKWLPLTTTFVLCLLWTTSAFANLSTYSFNAGSGSPYDMSSGATDFLTGADLCNSRTNVDDNGITATNIGFTFRFDGVDYTKLSISTNGLIGFFKSWGSTYVSTCWTNALTAVTGGCFGQYNYTLDSIPQIAAYWDDLRIASTCDGDAFDGAIRYKVFGSSPNRVFVVDYKQVEFDYYNRFYADWQVRLFEGTNKIEFWYGGFGSQYYGDGGTIGLAAIDGTTFQSVTPGSPGSSSSSSVDDYVDPLNIAANTLYTFSPCEVRLIGNTAQGGTAAMTSGDNLLVGKSVQVGSTGTFQPFSLTLDPSPCVNRTYAFQLIGIYAPEYTISPGGTINAGQTLTPTITYTPSCPGSRPVTLRVTSSDGGDRTYTLVPGATPQTAFAGDISQGGTATVTSGDTLINGVQVIRNQTQTFQPITISNTNSDPLAPPVPVTFTLIDPNGQYQISTTSASLAGNQSVTPTITFAPTSVSFQEAQLVVSTPCDTRVYLLRGFSAAPGGILLADGVAIDSSTALFNRITSCVGNEIGVTPITVTNTGSGDFVLYGVEFYRTDTTYQQGTAPYALLRDSEGRPIPSTDYMLMLQPGTAPLTPNQALTFPFAVPEGQSRTIYAVFVGTNPGRRYARAFVTSNGQNIRSTDYNGELREGMFVFDLVARATGAMLAATPQGKPIRPLVMPMTAVDDTSMASMIVSNAGACDLLIRRDKLRIFSGDVHEFTLVDVLPNTQFDASLNAYRIAPGASDRITVRFTPSRSGTRLATLWMQTNDSTIWTPGVAERGAYYVDLHGWGRAGLDVRNVTLPPVLIGGTVGGTAVLENTSTAAVDIRSIAIVGPDAAQFSPSTTNPWPALPTRVLPGSNLRLDVELAPTGLPGLRRALIEVITTTSDTINVAIVGEAGTLELLASPSTLFDNVVVAPGGYVRRTVSITNIGTFPIRLQTPIVTGADSLNYTLGSLPRLTLSAGQTEYLEVTFKPRAQGTSTATLEIASNVATQYVQLGGEALSSYGGGDDTGEMNDGDPVRNGVSGVAVTGDAQRLQLDAIHPNPASASASLGFSLPTSGEVVVTLHDAAGRIVATVARGHYDAGRNAIRIDTRDLAIGKYHVRVAVDGTSSTTTLTVVR